mmetsp:Transcript_62447/g.146421  ORF Transcript_62447/g.146421 Transcript_62447/m.146421 type:complete len:204 (+) Transcript_62447:234-845(+)
MTRRQKFSRLPDTSSGAMHCVATSASALVKLSTVIILLDPPPACTTLFRRWGVSSGRVAWTNIRSTSTCVNGGTGKTFNGSCTLACAAWVEETANDARRMDEVRPTSEGPRLPRGPVRAGSDPRFPRDPVELDLDRPGLRDVAPGESAPNLDGRRTLARRPSGAKSKVTGPSASTASRPQSRRNRPNFCEVSVLRLRGSAKEA